MTAFGLELLATVHWVGTREGATEQGDIERAMHNWSTRKAQFTPAQIQLAADRLGSLGWLRAPVAD